MRFMRRGLILVVQMGHHGDRPHATSAACGGWWVFFGFFGKGTDLQNNVLQHKRHSSAGLLISLSISNWTWIYVFHRFDATFSAQSLGLATLKQTEESHHY